MKKILLSNHYSESPFEMLRQLIPSGFEVINLEKAEVKYLVDKAPQADYIMASGRLRISKEVIENAPNLKMIQRTGVGLDTIDFSALKERNIPLYVNKGINSTSVAEHTLMLILATIKNLRIAQKDVLNEEWKRQSLGLQNFELSGKKIGLIGFGSIAKKVAKMLSGFNVDLYYYSRRRVSEEEENFYDVKYMEYTDLISRMDIVSLHCPSDGSTYHMINENTLSLMKKNAIIINTARGSLINEGALYNAIKDKTIMGAGLDVFEKEPLSKYSKLLKLENVITTPHIAGITHDSFTSMMKEGIENIVLFEEGKYNLIEDRRYVYD